MESRPRTHFLERPYLSSFNHFTRYFAKVKAEDNAGNISSLDDVFYVLKDTTPPAISDFQDGDEIWRNTNNGYYNIDFSATSYWQSRDRMTTIDRLKSNVYWVFAKDGIEKEIYKAVCKKKDYTVRHFKKDLLTL